MSADAEAAQSDRDDLLEKLARLGALLARTLDDVAKLDSNQSAQRLLAVVTEARAALAELTAQRQTERSALMSEMQRVERTVRELSNIIDDPASELPTVIKKDVERSELQSYLNGIRFVLNGSPAK